MADQPVATLCTGHSAKLGRPPWVRQTSTGYIGERCYWINCDDPDKSLEALGLPRQNDPWSAGRPALKAQECECQYVAGTSSPSTGIGGVCVAKVSYATASGGRLPPPGPNVKYTYFVPGTSSIQAVYDARYGTPEYPAWNNPDQSPADPVYADIRKPIMEGRGTSVAVGNTQAHVVTYFAASAFPAALLRMIELQRLQAVNDAALSLPPLLGALSPFSFEAGQVRYVTFESPSEVIALGSLVRVTHILELAPDFDFRWMEEDQYGKAFGPVIQSQMNKRRSFAGLWS